jgi:hypothetical protein
LPGPAIGATSGITSVIADTATATDLSATTDSSGNSQSEVQGANQSHFNIKNTLNTRNLDELFIETLNLSTLVYNPLIGTTKEGSVLYRITEGVYNPVLFCQFGSTLYVAFKGTETISEWMTDFDFRYRKFSGCPIFDSIVNLDPLSDLECHKGFLDALAITYEEVRREVDKFYKLQDVIFTGHPLGAGFGYFNVLYI